MRTGLFVYFITLLLILTACSTTPEQQATTNKPTANLAWPQAPADPRIKFETIISDTDDFYVKKGAFSRLLDVVFGKNSFRLVRPMAIIESGTTLYIADPGVNGVHCINRDNAKYQLLGQQKTNKLQSPVGLAANEHGHVFIADSMRRQIFISKKACEPLQVFITTHELNQPTGVKWDTSTQTLFVVDTKAHTVKQFSNKGKLLNTFGQRGLGEGEFNFPTMITLDSNGLLYVSDSMNFRIQVFTNDGRFVRQFGRLGNGSGDFSRPKGLAIDQAGHLYVVDSLFHSVQIFNSEGEFLLNIGGQGQAPGEFWLPTGIYISSNNKIYVADSHNQRVQVFSYIEQKT
ncbi:MAG: 6-bladed beta-propeller [Gammaproteobacteria bacterium]|nr:6-bladed beta-propeller [Gammaproteobacteria bacterium]MDH5730667.1 6-bladed beta-propeller [Gammaproteobacteria bacterium]